ncbi:MAG: ATP-binding cassette domain-containing protein [Myxococcota bacterium]
MSASLWPIVVEDVVIERRGDRLLGPLSLGFEKHGRCVIMGPNGAGKSLTLRVIHGLIEPDRGRVRMGDASGARARRAQAMVFERPVHLRRSALANVEYALAVRGVARAERRERAHRALERTGLLDLARRSARVLSAGEQQRLSLARAWALEPEVLLLDEPTAALDPSATRAVESIIESIAAAGTKVIMTTHDLGQARRLADEVVFLNRGVLVERTRASRFFDAPSSEMGRAFLKGELLW